MPDHLLEAVARAIRSIETLRDTGLANTTDAQILASILELASLAHRLCGEVADLCAENNRFRLEMASLNLISIKHGNPTH